MITAHELREQLTQENGTHGFLDTLTEETFPLIVLLINFVARHHNEPSTCCKATADIMKMPRQHPSIAYSRQWGGVRPMLAVRCRAGEEVSFSPGQREV